MWQYQAIVLLGTLAQNGIVTAGSLPRGVGPEFAKFYEIQDTFTCIGRPSITIPASRVNDNSCDCPDGSDEPGTAACASLDPLSPPQPLAASLSGTTNTTNALPGFWCENKSHIGTYVPFLYVNDGVCDYDLCCDGSEEYGGKGGVKCENKCDEIGKEWRRIDKERRDNAERANKRRRTMVKEAKELRRRVEAKVGTLASEIKELETKRDDLKAKLEDAKRQDLGKVVSGGEGSGGKLGVLSGLAKARVNELRDTLGKVVGERHQLEDQVAELEGILSAFKEEYNPNFNDEGVKKAVRAWEDYAAKKTEETAEEADIEAVLKEDSETSGINWKEFEEDEVTDTDILYSLEAYLPGPVRDFIHARVNLLRIWLIENGMLADASAGKGESRLVKAAREAHEGAESELKTKQKELGNQQKDLDETDYGADDIFRQLKGKCVAKDSGEYTYELCWLEKTSQKSKKGGGATNMGNFKRFDTDVADEDERLDGKGLGRGRRIVLRYENGQHCWNGPNRRTDVWLGCAETEELWRVSELEKCVYKMEVGTPAACEGAANPNEPAGKDEL